MNGGRRVVALEVFERVAEALSMPDGARMLLGLAPANPKFRRPCEFRASSHVDAAF
jgi:hypothetical protein